MIFSMQYPAVVTQGGLLVLEEKAITSESVLKVRFSRIQFPNFCPVCLQPATEITKVMFVSGGHYGRYNFHDYKLGSGLKSIIRVPTCDLHTFQGIRGEHKVYWIFFTMVAFVPIFFLFYSTTNAFFMGRDILPSLLGLVLMSSIVSLFTLFIFWPRSIQRYFKVLDMVSNDIDILLKLKNRDYQVMFVEMNAMHVSIIREQELVQLKEKS